MKSKVNIPVLLIFHLISLAAGFVGSLFTTPAIPTWYAGLNKPFFNPPSWLFAPVWTILYLLMGYSSYLIYISKSKLKNSALQLYAVQLLANVLWSILFFGLQNPILAFVDIVILIYLVVMTATKFGKISSLAGKLLYPYIAWSLFASALNLAIIVLN